MALENSIDVNSVTPQEVLLRLRLIFHLIFVRQTTPAQDLRFKTETIRVPPESPRSRVISQDNNFVSFLYDKLSSPLQMKYFPFSDEAGVFPFIQYKTKLISMHRKAEPGLMYNLLKPLARVSRTYNKTISPYPKG